MKSLTLQNGIPVMLAQMEGTDVVTALILFKVGSRHERPDNNGVSHFVEHLFFKGTTHRPTTLDISRELDGVGADYNAFTSKDYTGYYIKVAASHTELAIDILEDLLFHPIFDPEEINRERGVIIEEINMYEDNPMSTAEELSEQLLFGAAHPLGYRIAGPRKNILSLRREEILHYRDTHYHSKNMMIVLAGNLPKRTQQWIHTRFDSAPQPNRRTPKFQKFYYRQERSRVHVVTKKTAQSHLALSFPGPTYTSREFATANLLSVILGGNMSSRLFIQVRERLGLCYYIRSTISPYEDMGAFTIQAGFDTLRIHKAIAAITEELKKIRSSRLAHLTDAELQKAKEYVAGKMSLRLEDSEEVASWWGKQALFMKSLKSPELFERAIRSVRKSDVLKLAARTFVKKHANLVIIGPYAQSEKKGFQTHFRL